MAVSLSYPSCNVRWEIFTLITSKCLEISVSNTMKGVFKHKVEILEIRCKKKS